MRDVATIANLLTPGDWLHGELFGKRVVFVTGSLDGLLAARVAAELMTLDADSAEPIDVYLDSPEGALEAAFVLIDTLDLLRAPSRTHALGEVGGAVVGILAAGRERTAAPHARIRLVEPSTQIKGSTDHLVAHLEQQKLLLERFRERLARATGRTTSQILDDLRQGSYLDAREALEYGLIDGITTTRQGMKA